MSQGTSAILDLMTRETARLRSYWGTKLEIDTRNAEYQAQAKREREAQAIPDLRNKPTTKRTSKPLSKSETERRRVIFGAIQAGLKGPKYCSELDLRGLPVPLPWKEHGCPETYTQAYRDARWSKRIQDEKCNYRERFDQASPSDREAIIEGTTSTRRTRQ
jgi:hypothetical protein